jgi:hypothetical protein
VKEVPRFLVPTHDSGLVAQLSGLGIAFPVCTRATNCIHCRPIFAKWIDVPRKA